MIPEYPESAIFEVCAYMNPSDKCTGCPRDVKDARYGIVHPGCRLLAEEMIETVLMCVNRTNCRGEDAHQNQTKA